MSHFMFVFQQSIPLQSPIYTYLYFAWVEEVIIVIMHIVSNANEYVNRSTPIIWI